MKYGQPRPDRLHYERYEGTPLDEDYQERYWGRLETLSNYPVLPRQRGSR